MTDDDESEADVAGPLEGLTVLELAGIGPGPFAGMMLADMGADVIRIDRPGGNPFAALGHDVLFRNRRALNLDLKSPEGVEVLLRLVEQADAIYEGYRPGVAERLGFGPDVCLARNPRLVYGRMTGWGQDGPMAPRAGHDINYIALSGALYHSGRAGQPPTPALNLVGDFGGGAMFLAFGMLAGLLQARSTGVGQVVDAAMVDGASALMHMFFAMKAQGLMKPERGSNLLDGGAPFYTTYETADHEWVALGPIEPHFYAELREKLQLDDPVFDNQMDASRWPEQRARLAEVIAGHTRDELDELLAGTDACYAPVLDLEEAAAHPHNVARGVHIEVDGIVQPAPVPRFSVTTPDTPTPSVSAGAHTREVLEGFGFADDEVADLLARGIVTQD